MTERTSNTLNRGLEYRDWNADFTAAYDLPLVRAMKRTHGAANEVFTTGAMGESTPVLEADGRRIGDGSRDALTKRLQAWHREHIAQHGTPLPF